MNSQNARRAMAGGARAAGSGASGWSWTNLLRDLVATWRLIIDPSVPGLLKLALPFMALAYLISPIDLIPLMPLDDIAVLMLAARLFVALAPRDAVDRAFHGGAAPNRNAAGPKSPAQDEGEVIDTTWRVIE
jgi:uncharacterized membrane protein YkvA (DUF1232 family)